LDLDPITKSPHVRFDDPRRLQGRKLAPRDAA